MARQNDFIDKVDEFVGNKIYMLRLAKGLSRQQLSESVGVTHQQLQKYEKGTNRLTIGRLILIAKALGKPLSYFYAGLDNQAQEEEVSATQQRLCIEVSRNFMRLTNPDHQNAVNTLIKSLIKNSA